MLRVGESYVGTVSEGGGRVEVEPPIRADNGPICGYRLLATHMPNIPFEVSLKWVQGLGGRVEVEPPIRADNGPICGYRLIATHTPNIPFEVSPKWVQGVGAGGGGAPHQSGQRSHLRI